MYRNAESLYCVLGTNIVLLVHYISKTNQPKQTNKLREKEISFVVMRGKGVERENWTRIVKGTNFQSKNGPKN